MSDMEMCIHNDENTFFKLNCIPSHIDHIWSNCSHRIPNVITVPTILSPDHRALQCFLNIKIDQNCTKIIKTRNWRAVSTKRLQESIELNPALNELFSFNDPEVVTSILMSELNNILNDIAPPILRQVGPNMLPYVNQELKNDIKAANQLLTRAIQSCNVIDWQNFR